MRVSDHKRRPNAAIMGESGSGKTTILARFAQLMDSVYVTSDADGMDTFQTLGIDAELVLIDNWERVWDGWDAIRVGLKNGARSILLDDFGATQEQIVRKASTTPRTADEYRMNPQQRSETIRAQLLRGDRRLGFQQWGEIGGAGDAFLYEIKHSTAQLIICTVLEEARNNPRTGVEQLYPDLAGGLRYTVLSKFSLVASAFKAFDKDMNVHFCLSSLPHPRVPTKDRVGVPRTWVDPQAGDILLHMAGKEDQPPTDLEKEIGIGIPS